MSAHALAGLAALNALYVAAGASFVWLVRGLDDWIEVLRHAGLAYLVGVVLSGVAWVGLLLLGVPFSLGVIVAVPVLLGAVFGVAAHRRGRGIPRGAPPVGGRTLLVTAVGIAAVGVALEALFRAARLSGLYEFDSWAFWVPKGKAIYYFGGLDLKFFTELPGASYPPLIPVLDAAAFFAMGGTDVVTLHVQYWLLGVGFVWAVAGLLADRVPAWMLWPFVLLLVVGPRLGRRFDIAEADLFLDFLFVLAAVLMVRWLTDRDRWALIAATVLISGMVVTKREGLLLAALLFLAALVTTTRRWRATWPALGVSVAVVAVVAVPWRVWYVVHDIQGEAGSQGLVRRDGEDVFLAALRRALDVFLDPGYWSLIVPLFVAAVLIAALARVRTSLLFLGLLAGLVVLGGVWATWVFSQTGPGFVLGGNFVIRYMGAAALLCVVATPLLLSEAWGRRPESAAGGRPRRPVQLAAAIVAVPLIAYPALSLAGGMPRFPSVNECTHPATRDADNLEVVYGRFDSPLVADELLGAVTAVGLIGAEAEPDGCGRWKVSYDAIASLAQGQALAEQARQAGFPATVEYEG